jgi:hypothetical protein
MEEEKLARNRKARKAPLKVMIYSVHNLPLDAKTSVMMIHGSRIVNVGVLKNNRPKWN